MLELAATAAIALALGLSALLFLRWFAANADGVGDMALCGALIRGIVLVLLLFWIYPAYSERMITDADTYYQLARDYAGAIAAGQWHVLPRQLGTEMMGLIGAVLYLATRCSQKGMHALSAVISLAACLLFWGAVRVWRGNAPARKYLVAVMFWPSVLLWSSAFGKDSIAFLALALVSHGYSRICRYGTVAVAIGELFAGMLLAGLVRPHVAFLAAGAILMAEFANILVLRRSGRRRPFFLAGMLVLAGLSWAGTSAMTAASGGIGDSPTERLLRASVYTSIGESAVEHTEIASFADLLMSFPSSAARVLFRPWPWEAHNSFATLAAIEGAALLALALWRLRAILRNARFALGSSFGIFCLSMAVLLLALSSTVSNFGIGARNKAQILPFLFAVAVTGKAPRAGRLAS